jgi:hypothetical protein
MVDPTEPPASGAGGSRGAAAPAPGPDPTSGETRTVGDGPAAAVRLAVQQVTDSVVETAAVVVKPQAAAAVASSFGFPLALTMLVVLFLLIQPRVDRADPRLRATAADPIVGFEDEETL